LSGNCKNRRFFCYHNAVMGFIRKRLALKMGAVIFAAAAAVFAAAFWNGFRIVKQELVADLRHDMKINMRVARNRIDGVLYGVQAAPYQLARLLEKTKLPQDNLERALSGMVSANDAVFGAAAAFEPYGFSEGRKYFAPYASRSSGKISVKQLVPPKYRYTEKDWYAQPRLKNGSVWSEPYFDEGGGDTLMFTYSAPFYGLKSGKKTFAGVITSDVSFEWLSAELAAITASDPGYYGFLLSSTGVIIAETTHSGCKTVFELAAARKDSRIAALAAKMLAGEEGLERVASGPGGPAWVYYAPMSNGWTLAIAAPESALFAKLNALEKHALLIGLAGFLLLFAAVFKISSSLTVPLKTLSLQTAEIAKGNFDAPLKTHDSQDEVGELSRSFENMRRDIQQYIRALEGEATARQKMESELEIARAIQTSLLPKQAPCGPGFSLGAALEPAKTVGGDFYDFFMPDDSRLFIAIGDVSGKGMPAALFMAAAKTALRAAALRTLYPSEILRLANEELAPGNDMMMFATVFCATLDTGSGELKFSNAGHPPPLFIKDSTVEFLTVPPGKPLGLDERAVYKTGAAAMHDGNALVLYTDGITESQNEAGEIFSEERLLALAGKVPGGSPEHILNRMFQAAHGFAGNAPQFDDMTALVLRRGGDSKAVLSLVLKNDMTETVRLLEELDGFFSVNSVSGDAAGEARLVAEELATNGIKYAYGGARGEVFIRVELAGGDIIIEVSDTGTPFDPASACAGADKPPRDRAEGGAGLKLVRKLSSSMRYRRNGGMNITTVCMGREIQ